MNFPETYYAVIFSSELRTGIEEEYSKLAEEMDKLSREQKGYLGIESVRQADGSGITVSYWETEEDIKNWKQNLAHLEAQKTGKQIFYSSYTLRVCKVEREYAFNPLTR